MSRLAVLGTLVLGLVVLAALAVLGSSDRPTYPIVQPESGVGGATPTIPVANDPILDEDSAIGRPVRDRTIPDPSRIFVGDVVARLISRETAEAWLDRALVEVEPGRPVWIVALSTPGETSGNLLGSGPDGDPADGVYFVYEAGTGLLMHSATLPDASRTYDSVAALQSETLAIETPVFDPSQLPTLVPTVPDPTEGPEPSPTGHPYP